MSRINRRHPIKPTDPGLRAYTEAQIAGILAEVLTLGRQFGLLFPSTGTDTNLDGRILVDFGNAPASTLLNLHTLLLDHEEDHP
ncbi:hypothetical protein ACIGZJ_29445 [Kitasatospora sp. NPDC052868]|uniref:hypothetical protein n=1 Tax=Kitasatospora sp. NPDC052868 TaxID=3364060 RepID=UPI0037CAAB08